MLLCMCCKAVTTLVMKPHIEVSTMMPGSIGDMQPPPWGARSLWDPCRPRLCTSAWVGMSVCGAGGGTGDVSGAHLQEQGALPGAQAGPGLVLDVPQGLQLPAPPLALCPVRKAVVAAVVGAAVVPWWRVLRRRAATGPRGHIQACCPCCSAGAAGEEVLLS